MSERWRDVPGQEGRYQVSDRGRVRSLDRVVIRRNGSPMQVRGRILSVSGRDLSGHHHVNIGRKTRPVHVLVMEAFTGQRPAGMDIRHLNGDHSDNRLANLVYGTRSENAHDQVRHGVHNQASKTECKRGHPFDEINTYRHPSGRRVCRTCRSIHKRQSMQRKAVA